MSNKTQYTSDQLKMRVLKAKAILGEKFQLRATYEYLFGKVSDLEYAHIQNCYYTRKADEDFTNKLELIAENKNNMPLNPTSK